MLLKWFLLRLKEAYEIDLSKAENKKDFFKIEDKLEKVNKRLSKLKR